MDNCSGNRASNGLKSMIDIIRRHEYNFLRDIRGAAIGKYIPTVMVSCMLHDSNLVNVMLSKLLRELDTTKPDPFQPEVNPAVPEIKGNKATESFSFNAVRFIAGCFKKNKDWKSFMRSTYGDVGGIAPIKSSRFWAALIIGGDYLFPRFDQIWEFYETIHNSQKDKQIVATLKDMLKNKELFEFDCLMMAVDYHGFHSDFNFGACHNECNVQADEVKKIVALHKECMKQNADGVQKMLEYWREHATPAIVDRKMFQWRLQHYRDNACEPTAQQQEQQRAAFELAAPTDPLLTPPPGCHARMRCMHTAIVDKLEQMLDSILVEGPSVQQQLSGAPNQQLPVEDIFNFSRKQHDRCSVTRIGILDCRRRVSTAPSLGTVAGIPRPYTITNPPRWYPDWLRQRLRERARQTIREKWPSQDERAELRWEMTCKMAEVADERMAALQVRVEGTERTMLTLPGGYIGLEASQDECRQRLPPLQCLTLEQYDEVNWEEPGTTSRWTNPVIVNQFRLRNVKDERTASEALLLVRKGVIKKGTDALPLSGTRKELVKRLKLVVEAEHAAAATDRAVSVVQRELAERAEQAERGRERRGRSTRGTRPERFRNTE